MAERTPPSSILEEHLRDPAYFDPRPGDTEASPPLRHSDFWKSPDGTFQDSVRNLANQVGSEDSVTLDGTAEDRPDPPIDVPVTLRAPALELTASERLSYYAEVQAGGTEAEILSWLTPHPTTTPKTPPAVPRRERTSASYGSSSSAAPPMTARPAAPWDRKAQEVAADAPDTGLASSAPSSSAPSIVSSPSLAPTTGPDQGRPAGDEPGPPAPRLAFAKIDCPRAWVAEKWVTVRVGLGPAPSRAIVGTPGPVVDVSRPIEDLEVVIIADPRSIRLSTDQHRFPLPVTADDPFPTVAVEMIAILDLTLSTERRIGAQYWRGGKPVGFAWRSFRAADSGDDLADAEPVRPPNILVDLTPLLADAPPDLVVTITHGDSKPTAVRSYVWSAYSPREDVVVADRPNVSTIADNDARKFATDQRRVVDKLGKGVPLFDELHGWGRLIGESIPPGVAEALARVAALPGQADMAPTVLLLTEEPFVPWELAVLPGGHVPRLGGDSPFLGSHLGIGRWPLALAPPQTAPVYTRTVRRPGVLTAHYDGIANWPLLVHAEREAAMLADRYRPMITVNPVRDEVVRCLRGDPPIDWLHVALHGQFDSDGLSDGIVLLQQNAAGALVQEFLTTNQIGASDLVAHPFVFLNACQLGAGNTVLGAYSGIAATLVKRGATGVVAALWNVDDDVAAQVTETFYADVFGPDRVPVAEALRRIRAGYTEDAVRANPATNTATLLAYQYLGHPRLAVKRDPASD